MQKKKFKLGFLGGGTNSTIGNIHNLASKLDSRWSLVSGFFSRNKLANIKSAKIYGVDPKRTYNSLKSFIENEKSKIDAVAVLVPTPGRHKYLLELLKYKIPIISEKPLVDNLKDLPDEIILYRIVVADSKSDIDLEQVGSHYSMDKPSLLDSHSYVTGYGENYFLLKVKVPKKLIDKNETILNNILYPNEKEVTLKNKGRGIEVLSIKKIKI